MKKLIALQPETCVLGLVAVGVAFGSLSLSTPAGVNVGDVKPYFGGLATDFAPLPERQPLAGIDHETPFDSAEDRQRRTAVLTIGDPFTGAADPATLRLTGMIDNGALRKVLIQNLSEETATWVLTGETIFGWSVQSITNQSVRLERDAQMTELFLYPE